ncbi:nuclear transport factor 2 family protein [soil metagenome]
MTYDESPHAATVRRYWESAEARDWAGFAETLAADVVYECPQTRERVRGREAYVRFNREFPGDWHLVIDEVVADERGAVSHASFAIGGETMTGICFFGFDAEGRVRTVRDYWPESYEAPADRAHLVERY